MTGDPHGPNKFSNYIETHDAVMGHFVDKGFIVEDGLLFESIGRGLIRIHGTVMCLGEIRLDVNKMLKVREGEGMNAVVQTVEYNYNASIVLGNILRYDSPHDHRPIHHVHRGDPFDSSRLSGTVGPSTWPTLGEVITELEEWYYANYDRLNPSYRLGEDESDD